MNNLKKKLHNLGLDIWTRSMRNKCQRQYSKVCLKSQAIQPHNHITSLVNDTKNQVCLLAHTEEFQNVQRTKVESNDHLKNDF